METIELWYAVDQDGEVYSVKDKLFSNVEVPQITWDNEPVKLEMTYEVTQKS